MSFEIMYDQENRADEPMIEFDMEPSQAKPSSLDYLQDFHTLQIDAENMVRSGLLPTWSQVRTKYYELSSEYHPDRDHQKSDKNQVAVNLAYQHLKVLYQSGPQALAEVSAQYASGHKTTIERVAKPVLLVTAFGLAFLVSRKLYA